MTWNPPTMGTENGPGGILKEASIYWHNMQLNCRKEGRVRAAVYFCCLRLLAKGAMPCTHCSVNSNAKLVSTRIWSVSPFASNKSFGLLRSFVGRQKEATHACSSGVKTPVFRKRAALCPWLKLVFSLESGVFLKILNILTLLVV